jgi:sugar phosphate isomerase/epimerase
VKSSAAEPRAERALASGVETAELGPDDLVFCAGTLMRRSLRDLVAAAHAGGFQGLSLWPHHVEGARSEGRSDAELRRLLSDHGLVAWELEPVLSWLPEGALAPALANLAGPPVEEFFALAHALEVPTLLAVDGFGARTEPAALADAFAALCDDAARHGLRVKLEFTPWSAIPDAKTAADLVLQAGSDAGVMLDSWHHFRGANDLDMLRALPRGIVTGVQLNDASAAPTGEPLAQESMHARRLPGEGDIDLVELVRTLDAIGCPGPYGAEIFSDGFDALDSLEVGRRAGRAMRRLLSAARAD